MGNRALPENESFTSTQKIFLLGGGLSTRQLQGST